MKKLLILCLLAMLAVPLIYAQMRFTICTYVDGGVTCNNQFYNDYCESPSTGEQYANTRICKNITSRDCALLVGVNRLLCPYGCKDGACLQEPIPSIRVISPNGGETFSDNQIISIKTKIFSNKIGSIRIILVEEFSGSVYEVGTVYNMSMSAINYYYYVDLDLPKLKSMGYIPAPGAYRAIVQWNSNDLTEKWDDKSDGYFKISYLQQKCTDSDGGKNYYVKGETSGYNPDTYSYYTAKDMCLLEKSDGNDLQESWCEENILRTGRYTCSYGCKDGACIIYPTQVGCISSPVYNEDTCDGYRCVKNLNVNSACYSLDQCLSNRGDGTCVKSPAYKGDLCDGYRVMPGISEACYTYEQCESECLKTCSNENEFCGGIAGIQCCSGLTCELEGTYADASGKCVKTISKCTDSDNGKDYYTKGTAISGSESKTDSCTYCTGACSETGECPEPVCGGLVEYYCEAEQIKSIEYVCPNNCKDGVCIQITQKCTDSDGGKNYYIKGITKGVDSQGNSITEEDNCGFTVSGSNEKNYDYVNEFYCSGSVVYGSQYNCPYGCRDGACVSKEGGCMDSDGGEDYYTKGYVTTLNGTFNDECYSDGIKLFEYSCFNNDQKRTDYTCPYGCKDGACIQSDHCTNGVQDDDETGIDCGGSCSPCAEVCNKDGVCDLKQEENSDNCPEDCYCGDEICDSLENYKDCPEDCGYCAPEWECHLEPATCPEEGIQNKVCIDIKCGTEDKRVEALKCVPGTCSGCLSEGTCYPVTTRMLLGEIPSYCDVTKTFAKQKELGASCQNNYECKTNECSDGECISIKKQLEETRSLIQKILDWIKNIF